MSVSSLRVIIFLLLLGCVSIASAETLVIPIGSQADRERAGVLPSLGMKRAEVRDRWGEPLRRYGAVGNPPISRWEYAEFEVYFEYDHVIHAVVPHQAPPPVVTVIEEEKE